MPDIIFSAEGVKNQLLKIKIDKASGPDLIPARILRDAASELAVVFSSLFQQSYDAGTLPHAWKLTNICAIFKKGSKADPKNYRPVSLTSLTSKVMEHIVSCQISRHLNANQIISPHQHGFQRGLSCETQLITVIHEWASVLNVHGQVDVVFLDFAKAFDSVPHERLLLKAAYYGIRNKANIWLRSFLTGRSQRVVINGSASSWSSVVSGVPQGTVLGPILFLMFINDLPKNITSGIKLFADDCVLYRPTNSVSDHLALQRNLDQLEKWSSIWQMKFAPSKCFVMSVTLKKSPSQFSYFLCNVQLDGARHQKYLGVYITCTLCWQLQCDEAKKKAMRVLGILQRNLSSCDRSVKERSYLSLVRPIVEYATVAWSPHTKKGIDCIEAVQRRAARFVNNDYSRHSSVSSMLTDLNWPSLQSRRRMYDLGMFYKIHRGQVNISVPYELTSVPAYGRHDFKIRLPSSSVDAYKHSFYVRSIPAWNALPADVVRSASYPEFIRRVPTTLTC